MTLTIRPADLRDTRGLRKMIHALARHHGDVPSVTEAELHRDLFRPPVSAYALVAEIDGGLCGYALLAPLLRAHTAERAMDVINLYVSPDHRREGIGRKLVEAARAAAVNRGASRLTIGTSPKNPAAQAFYRHLGLTQMAESGPRFVEIL